MIYEGVRGVDELIRKVLLEGVEVGSNRTGTKTLAIFDAKIVIKGGFEFVTNRLASPRLAFEEFMFFLRGQTDTRILEEKGVHFWAGNTSREFLDSRGLFHLPEGDIGAAYSRQWRDASGIDQLDKLLLGLRGDLYGRRHLVTLWNPSEEYLMPLTPCHHTMQIVVLPDGMGRNIMHLKLVNRSVDVVFGCAYALYQYRMFQIILCCMYDCDLGNLSLDMSQVHIYENQIEYARELIEREYVDCELVGNSLRLSKGVRTLEDLLNLTWEDWEMSYEYNKEPFETKRPKMVT